MEQILQRIIKSNFSELKGAVVEATVPIPQTLINELLRVFLRANKTISSIEVTIHPQNRISLQVKAGLLPWPIDLRLKLDQAVDLASYGSPKLRAWMENNRLLGSLGSVFNALPVGVRLYGDQVVIDLGALLRTPEQRKYLDLIKSVDIRTEKEQVILDARLEVER